MSLLNRPGAPIERLEVAAYTVPTSSPEGDGTLEWNSTGIVIVEAFAGGECGVGYSYTHPSAADIVRQLLAPLVRGHDSMEVTACWAAMVRAVRNLGRPGICSTAIAAIDAALWDLKARLLGVPLAVLLGPVRASVPLYFSGGFTTYPDDELRRQFEHYAAQGFTRLKMKIGAQPERDLHRIRAARAAIGSGPELFIDANGAYTRKQALAVAERAGESGVTWFEEPVSSDDLEGLRLLRDRAPAGMDIAAGEYGYDAAYFRRMLEAGAVDVLQADVTRCAGITGFLQADALADAHMTPLSAHTAPAVHLHVCTAARRLVHLEYFHDHIRIERMFFDGIVEPQHGELTPDLSAPGTGLIFKQADARRYAA